MALGDRFHYIFKNEKDLIKILRTSDKIKYQPTFYPFTLDEDNHIHGRFTLYVSKSDLSEKDVVLLTSMGFDDSDSYNNETLMRDFSVNGIRYNTKKGFDVRRSIGNKIRIKVLEPRNASALELAAKALATPVTVAADAVLVVFGGALYAVSFSINP